MSLSLDNIVMGVDLDDVLYQTSKMIIEMGTDYLKKNQIKHKLNTTGYLVEDVFGVNSLIARDIEKICEWQSPKYISKEAVYSIKRMQNKYNAKLIVITARDQKGAGDLLYTLFREESFQVDVVRTSITNKAETAIIEGCDVMLDDYTNNIKSFSDFIHCRPILVSPEHVLHNKPFASTYKHVLYNWNNLEEVLIKAIGDRYEPDDYRYN